MQKTSGTQSRYTTSHRCSVSANGFGLCLPYPDSFGTVVRQLPAQQRTVRHATQAPVPRSGLDDSRAVHGTFAPHVPCAQLRDPGGKPRLVASLIIAHPPAGFLRERAAVLARATELEAMSVSIVWSSKLTCAVFISSLCRSLRQRFCSADSCATN